LHRSAFFRGYSAKLIKAYIKYYKEEFLLWLMPHQRFCHMAEETEPTDISSATVIGIGVVLFVVVVGFWYLFLK